ncbi:MAG: hypothetical protein EXS64_20025 [Candidatus Latescibacteria bacterium]|nr:hypothetical protein [Candidatus Latescibacterota bacterium]
MASKKADLRRKAEYVERVTRGEGFVPWQDRDTISPEERAFRKAVERRKEEMLAARVPVKHPVLVTEKEFEQARRNIRSAAWARRWFRHYKRIADHVAGQDGGYVERMIPEQTSWTGYTFVCPNCIGVRSHEGSENAIIDWDYRNPDTIRCKCCGQVYPSDKYPETGRIVCPRAGQTITCYLNDQERRHPEDRSGKHAYQWAGHPIHVCFSGIVRERKVLFMLDAVRMLALAYRLTGTPRYARTAVQTLVRLSDCFRGWLYHDYWDTVADCDPLYAAWHDRSLPLEWKRNLFTSAYEKDEPHRAAMLQSYWGAGRVHPGVGWAEGLWSVCTAYDLTYDATDRDGKPLWTRALREKVERDLILEWVIEEEPFVGGRGKAENVTNKSPGVYQAQASVARCLGIPELADTALSGCKAIRDRSVGYDGFGHESPGYNASNLAILPILETLHGFRWPRGFAGRRGKVDPYRTDPLVPLMLRAGVDQLRTDGRYLPLSDTMETPLKEATLGWPPSGRRSSQRIAFMLEIGARRFPEYFADKLPFIYRYRGCDPTEYALMRLDAGEIAPKREPGKELELPEIYFPAWMTAILRHGCGKKGTVLALPFNPAGGHMHYDNLSLYYVDRGRTILGDQGYLATSPAQAWVKSTFSHNLVIVDGQQQHLRTGKLRRPSLRMMVTSPRVSVVEASSEVYDPCREYRRLVALIKGPDAQTFAVDIFRVKGGARHDYRLFSELASSDAEDGALDFIGLPMPPERPLPGVGASQRAEDISALRPCRAAEHPPSSWQAIWKEKGHRYRLWMLSQVDSVQASDGPGQEDREQPGRRVRYLDAVRTGRDLSSAFVAVHEPGTGILPITRAVRLEVPDRAGPDAAALRVESKWGTYLVFSEFRREAEVEGVRFRGKFGILCRTSEGGRWWLTCGATALQSAGFGFENAPASWSGRVVGQTETALTADANRPAGWTSSPQGVTNYVLVKTGAYATVQTGPHVTGLPVRSSGRDRILVDRFPLPKVTRFEMLEVRYCEAS